MPTEVREVSWELGDMEAYRRRAVAGIEVPPETVTPFVNHDATPVTIDVPAAVVEMVTATATSEVTT
jgi:hypothetical protein